MGADHGFRAPSLWAQPLSDQSQPFNLLGAYRRAKRSFTYLQTDTASEVTARITRVLDPFVEAWRPSTVAHNDFYDDQLLVLPDGRAALVALRGGRSGRSHA